MRLALSQHHKLLHRNKLSRFHLIKVRSARKIRRYSPTVKTVG
jgi:hypothetical protein